MNSDPELKIKITTTADTAGVEAAERAIKRVGESAGEAGSSGSREIKGLGREVKELSHLGHEAEGVLMGLSRGGLGGLAQAGTNAARIIKTLALSFGPFEIASIQWT